MRRALVTGANGFAGKRLCAFLESRGWETIGCDFAGGNCIHADIRNAEDLDRLIRESRSLSHVFHLAAKTFVPEAKKDPTDTFQANLMGTIYLAEAMKRHAPGARLIYISSGDAYGPPDYTPVTEEHCLGATHPYAMSKAAADHYCAWLGKEGGLDCVRVRPFNHSGAGQGEHFVLSSFAKQCAAISLCQQEPVIHVGNLDALRDFSHVDDIIRAYELIAIQGRSGAVYNVCSGEAITIRAALERLLAMLDRPVEVRPDPARQRPGEASPVPASCELIHNELGWKPEHTLDDVLRDLYDYWRAQLGAGSSA